MPGKLNTYSVSLSSSLSALRASAARQALPYYAIVELGGISASSDVLTQAGYHASATVGASWKTTEQWFPCAQASLVVGRGPTAAGEKGASINGAAFAAGVGYIVPGAAARARTTLFATFETAVSGNAGSNALLRGGVSLFPLPFLLVSASVAQALDRKNGYAYVLSVGLNRPHAPASQKR